MQVTWPREARNVLPLQEFETAIRALDVALKANQLANGEVGSDLISITLSTLRMEFESQVVEQQKRLTHAVCCANISSTQ